MTKKSITSIATFVTNSSYCVTSIESAKQIAAQYNAHLQVFIIQSEQIPCSSQPELAYQQSSGSHLLQTPTSTNTLENWVNTRLSGYHLPFSVVTINTAQTDLPSTIARHTRLSDLLVLPRPYGAGRAAIDEVLFKSGLYETRISVLMVPEGMALLQPIQNVIIAWNESPEALRAVHQSMPFLLKAKNTYITMIDPPRNRENRSNPGGALCHMLAQFGVRAKISILAKTMPKIAYVLNRYVCDKDVDLIVMGAYGQSKFRESILGNATRDMLELSDTPILFAR